MKLWRCSKCNQTRAAGATQLIRTRKGREVRCGICVECNRRIERERGRRRSAAKRGTTQLLAAEKQYGIGRSGSSIARPPPLAWEINARNDEAEAVHFDRLDPERAAKLRDRAQNWRALAAEIGSHGVRGRAP